MHHAYARGYSTLPGLRKIAPADVFEPPGPDAPVLVAAKRAAVAAGQVVAAEHDCPPALLADVVRFVREHHPLAPCGATLADAALNIPEDVALMRLAGGRDWLAAAHVCLPSGWRPEEKVGRPLEAIHAPIPGMARANSGRLAELMATAGPFERFVWGVSFSPDPNGHPDRPKAAFDPSRPAVWVKVERQVTVPFPQHGAGLFLIRLHVIPSADADRPALVRGLLQMTPDQRRYKGVAQRFDELIAYLSR